MLKEFELILKIKMSAFVKKLFGVW